MTMNVGIIVEGIAEYQALPLLLERLRPQVPHTILQPIHANISPNAPIGQIARAIIARVPILQSRRANMIVVLLDKEQQNTCCGVLASRIEQALKPGCGKMDIERVVVVIKDSCFENWLVADVGALQQMPRRFRVTQATVHKIAPNRADSINAQQLLREIVLNDAYEKVADAKRILKNADPLAMAANSRSVRRFLRVLGHSDYADQSLRPARRR